MSIDVETPDSPGWWLKRCADKLAANRKEIDPLFARYEGKQPMPPELSNAPEHAQRLYRTSRTNLAELVVKSTRYRLKLRAIQTGHDSGETGDEDAWKAWKAAGMIVESPSIITNMLVGRSGYALVQEHEGKVAATSEDPRQVVTVHDPVRQSVVRAAAKIFHDDDFDMDYAYLYRPGRRWVAVNPRRTRNTAARFTSSWSWSEDHGGAEGEPLPAGFESDVMIVRYRNDENVSEFERHADLFNRFDHLILQAMVIATLQAFKQRAIKVDPKDMPDTDPVTGEDIDYNDVFTADPAALWKLPQTAEMWESGAVDVQPIVTMATKQLEQVSAVTFTPLSAFTPEGANQSANGASLVREGMTFKVEDKQDRIGAAHEQTADLIFRMAALDVGEREAIRAVWAPAERYSLAEKADAWSKTTGLPYRTRLSMIFQFGPDEIARAETERMNDAVLFPAEATQPVPANG